MKKQRENNTFVQKIETLIRKFETPAEIFPNFSHEDKISIKFHYSMAEYEKTDGKYINAEKQVMKTVMPYLGIKFDKVKVVIFLFSILQSEQREKIYSGISSTWKK